ncbi:phosphoglycerate mutase family protein [Cryptosporidium andersoni]|uniref:phosphoglycerate mutase (2,3-diphosphoglycerate-dependent) n=1 Tax=Cryptosporidium andersoni TaxID=117008 RepID=A0A1J4MVH7_9CRYT|nr:phosphoglycerate mutase family protein [Cryptosporidium andersoni]
MMYRNMPVDLVLVRHGQSEGNLAQRLARQGELQQWTDEFRRRHNSLYRLTDRGRTQARIAGEYIRTNIGATFDKYFTSEYVRAMETAAMLGLPNSLWNTDIYLRERDRGILANKTHQERATLHSDEMIRKQRDAFYWQPSGGESLANLCLRTERVLENLSQNCAGLRVIIVCHGGVIKSFRALLERDRNDKNSKMSKINNCQIVWYTRRDPVRGCITSSYNWVKSICPWDLSLSSNSWRYIQRQAFTNEDLLQIIYRVPQLINAPAVDLLEELDIPSAPSSPPTQILPKNTLSEIDNVLPSKIQTSSDLRSSIDDHIIDTSDGTDENTQDIDSDEYNNEGFVSNSAKSFVYKYFQLYANYTISDEDFSDTNEPRN